MAYSLTNLRPAVSRTPLVARLAKLSLETYVSAAADATDSDARTICTDNESWATSNEACRDACASTCLARPSVCVRSLALSRASRLARDPLTEPSRRDVLRPSVCCSSRRSVCSCDSDDRPS
eukprot:5138806-Pleurochrysis_carterae.AAC.1